MSVQVAGASSRSRSGGLGGGNRYKKARARSSRTSWKGMGRFVSWGLYCGAFLIFLMGISFGLLAAYRWMTNYPFFSLREVQIEGNTRMTYNEVLSLGKVSLGENTLNMNIRGIESCLRESPWIRSVQISRVLPDKLKIVLDEREPAFWVLRDKEMYYADSRGNIIDKVEPSKFEAKPMLEIEKNSDAGLELFFNMLQTNAFSGLPFMPEQASWIRVGPGKLLVLHFEKPGITFEIGMDDWSGNVKRLLQVWKDVRERGEAKKVRGLRAIGNNVWVVNSGSKTKA